jgi:hypothetical protein
MASTHQISKYTTLANDVKSFYYKEPQKNQYGSKNSYILKSKDNATTPMYQLVFQHEPRMRAPYGISKPLETKNGMVQNDNPFRKSLDLSIETDSLLEALKALDEHNIKVISDNSEKWYGKKISAEVIKMVQYRHVVNEGKPENRGKYRPTLRTKLNLDPNQDSRTRFFVEEKNENGTIKFVEKSSDIIVKGCSLAPVIRISSIWIGSQFGCTIDITHCIVFPPPQNNIQFIWGMSDQSIIQPSSNAIEEGNKTVDPIDEDEDVCDDAYEPPSAPM